MFVRPSFLGKPRRISSFFSQDSRKNLGHKLVSGLAVEARQILDRLKRQIESTTAPPMILNSHCPACEFRDRCRAEALQRDDLSLMRGMSEKEILAQRRHGINTVAQFACTFRPKSVGAKRKKPPKRHLHALQARAVQDKKVYIVRAPTIPSGGIRVYLDVEGIPDRDFYYLVGVVVETDGRCSAHSFWADDESGERAIWFEFLALLRAVGDHTLFHYGSYEKTYITRMLRRYPSPDSPIATEWATVNVLAAIGTNIYFPVHGNGLKDVAGFLGATWGGDIGSGIECLAKRLRWEESRDSHIKDEIIEYNQEDCLAAQRAVQFLWSLTSTNAPSSLGLTPVSEIPSDVPRRFRKVEFQIHDMELINKCARFEYQQTKVFLRTDPEVRTSLRRKQSRRSSHFTANVEVRCDPSSVCPACGSSRLTTFRKWHTSKLLFDLKFTRSGVKRRIVKHISGRQQCLVCGKTFLPDTYPKSQKVGHGLSSWAVYQHVALRLSFEDIATSTHDLFGYPLSESMPRRALTRLAEIYRETREKMIEQLRSGTLIHADETKMGIRGASGYVWAFSGTQLVVYLFSLTREGTILQDTLKDFAGVLVSDFYAAYDAVKCPQQKCHLHLMRDINDDLLQHPFDEELRELARRYTLVLKPIVETVDKHGLRTKYLAKHRQNVRGFLDWVSSQAVVSEVAGGYKTRIGKYGDRLFTFLDYDGVPWNNNCAENAIKLVASRRRLLGTSMSESGLKDYLVFLSIYQTLRRKGLSLLKFLLSGETDLEAYVASHRRR